MEGWGSAGRRRAVAFGAFGEALVLVAGCHRRRRGAVRGEGRGQSPLRAARTPQRRGRAAQKAAAGPRRLLAPPPAAEVGPKSPLYGCRR